MTKRPNKLCGNWSCDCACEWSLHVPAENGGKVTVLFVLTHWLLIFAMMKHKIFKWERGGLKNIFLEGGGELKFDRRVLDHNMCENATDCSLESAC